MKHDDMRTIVVNEDFIIKPVNGFGNEDMIKQILATDRPDVMLIFTDPRFWYWLFEMSDVIHQCCPIAYWHLWDNGPDPTFNKVLYESTDLINCINYPTFEMVRRMLPNHPRVNYVPHAIPSNVYFSLSDDEKRHNRAKLLGLDRQDHFVGLWISRNARRKMPSDVLVSWKNFLDRLERDHGHRRATLVMHTDPFDQEGPNLHAVVDALDVKKNVVFSTNRVDFNEMNAIYSACDFVITRSSAEGFGLPTLEAMMAGLPIIALKTGGLTRQVVNWKTGEENGIALPVETRSLVGNQQIPFIWEDYVTHETVTESITKMYEFGGQKRKEVGLKAREYALTEYNVDQVTRSWDDSLTELLSTWRETYKRWESKVI